MAKERRIVEAGVQLRERELFRDRRVDGEQLAEGTPLVGGAEGGALDEGVRLFPGQAGALDERAAELAPESDELLFWAGLARAHMGDVEAGVAAVRRAAEVNPSWLVLLERLPPDFAPAGERVRRELAR